MLTLKKAFAPPKSEFEAVFASLKGGFIYYSRQWLKKCTGFA